MDQSSNNSFHSWWTVRFELTKTPSIPRVTICVPGPQYLVKTFPQQKYLYIYTKNYEVYDHMRSFTYIFFWKQRKAAWPFNQPVSRDVTDISYYVHVGSIVCVDLHVFLVWNCLKYWRLCVLWLLKSVVLVMELILKLYFTIKYFKRVIGSWWMERNAKG